MDGPAPKPGGVKNEPPAPAQPLDPEAEPARRGPPRPVATGWKVVLFVWVTAFGFLAAYELLWTLFKLLGVRQ